MHLPAPSSPAPFAERESLEFVTRRGARLLAAVDQVVAERGLAGPTLAQHQARRVRELLTEAWRVPLYVEKFRAAGFSPESFQSIEDLPKVPLLEKAELRAASLESLRGPAHPLGEVEQMWLLSSSGSTGVPSRIWRDPQSMWRFMAESLALFREWSANQRLESCLYFIDLAPGSVDRVIADLLRTIVSAERIVASSRPTEEQVAAVRKYRPDFISSYPSTLRNVAIALDRRGETMPATRLLHTTSEMLDRGTRALIARVFCRAKILETYTSTEAGLIGWPCPAGDRLHINETAVVCEIVDEAGRPTDGAGQVVVTDLTNQATPILRYRGLGDFARWETSPCGCGSKSRAIRHLEGRVADSILSPAGVWLSPYEVIDAIEDLPGIYQFQIVQHAAAEIEVKVIRSLTAREGTRLAEGVRAAVEGRLPGATCRLTFVEEILPPTGRHKVPLVVSGLAERRDRP